MATLVLAGMVLAGGCSTATVPPAQAIATSGASARPADADANSAIALLEPVMDPDSRDLLAVIAPEEDLEATIDVPAARAVQAHADAGGFRTELVNDGTVLVAGRRDDVLRFAAEAKPTRVALADDHRVDRWLPAARPSVEIPTPDLPYRIEPFAVDRSALAMTTAQGDALLAELARSTVTIDGRPYARLGIEGDCQGGSRGNALICLLRATGVTAGSGGRADILTITVDDTTGGRPATQAPIRQSIPRSLLRSAEWIARHDETAAAAIATYTRCCGGAWQPVQPGVITILWFRPCSTSAAPAGTTVADTGSCDEGLEVVVDVAAGTVVSVTARPGP